LLDALLDDGVDERNLETIGGVKIFIGDIVDKDAFYKEVLKLFIEGDFDWRRVLARTVDFSYILILFGSFRNIDGRVDAETFEIFYFVTFDVFSFDRVDDFYTYEAAADSKDDVLMIIDFDWMSPLLLNDSSGVLRRGNEIKNSPIVRKANILDKG
jgi:hypothetical protein